MSVVRRLFLAMVFMTIAMSTAIIACAPTPAPTPTPTATPIPEVALGDYLEGGTYALPGGAWIFDVPDGMRPRHSGRGVAENAREGSHYGFKDVVTGSLFTLYVLPGGSEVEFHAINHGQTPAARELATAWLAAVEASVRRPPGYVEPAGASGASGADPGPGTNPDGVPYLRDYSHSNEIFDGGRTYAIPGSDWLVDVPSGVRVVFWQDVWTVGGERYYIFQDAVTGSEAIVNRSTGVGGGSGSMGAVASSFRKRSSSQ